jgi:hypothetical protein
MSVTVTFMCDRTGCDNAEPMEFSELLYDEDADPRSVAAIERIVPEGWAYEYSGLEDVLHCPEHVGGSA